MSFDSPKMPQRKYPIVKSMSKVLDSKITNLEETIKKLESDLLIAQENRLRMIKERQKKEDILIAQEIKIKKIEELEKKSDILTKKLEKINKFGNSKKLNISEYVQLNWSTIIKSSFDGEELVIIKEISNDEQGYGHHSYEGYGIDVNGNLLWAFSSGCSCNGSCGTEHKNEAKTFEIDWLDEFSSIDPYTFNFQSVNPVTFSSY